MECNVRTALGSSTGTGASGAGESLERAVCLAMPSELLEGSNPKDRESGSVKSRGRSSGSGRRLLFFQEEQEQAIMLT